MVRMLPILLGVLCLLAVETTAQAADFKDDIGYVRLKTELGSQLPDGAGIAATQVEAKSGSYWMPNPADGQFSGKTITPKSGTPAGYSGHATTVGQLFYGNTSSQAPAVSVIDAWEQPQLDRQHLNRCGSRSSTPDGLGNRRGRIHTGRRGRRFKPSFRQQLQRHRRRDYRGHPR